MSKQGDNPLRHLPWPHHRCTSTLNQSESAAEQPSNGLFQHYPDKAATDASRLGWLRGESARHDGSQSPCKIGWVGWGFPFNDTCLIQQELSSIL